MGVKPFTSLRGDQPKQNNTHMYGETSCTTMPHFLDEHKREGEPDTFTDLLRSFSDGIDEYDAMDPRIKRLYRLGSFSI